MTREVAPRTRSPEAVLQTLFLVAAPLQLRVPEAGFQRRVPEAGLQRRVPEAGLQRRVPEAGLQRRVPEAGLRLERVLVPASVK